MADTMKSWVERQFTNFKSVLLDPTFATKAGLNDLDTELKSTGANSDAKVNVEVIAKNNELSYKPDSEQYIILYVDDGRTDLPDVWSIAQEYGIPLNVAVPTDTLNNRANNGQLIKDLLHDMEDGGCEIFSHSVDTNVLTRDTTREQALNMLKTSKELLLAEGFKVNGFCSPGGGTDGYAYKWEEKGFDDLVRRFYLYSDTRVFPYGIHKSRTFFGLNADASQVQSYLNRTKKVSPAGRFGIHGLGVDVTEEFLRAFISTALEQGFIFTTEHDYYISHAVSITEDRLNKLEKVVGAYTTFDWAMYKSGFGFPSYDNEVFPYSLYYLSNSDPTIIVSSAPLIVDKTVSNNYKYRKSDNSGFKYERYRFANGVWAKDANSDNADHISTYVIRDPAYANYELVDNEGTVIVTNESYYGQGSTGSALSNFAKKSDLVSYVTQDSLKDYPDYVKAEKDRVLAQLEQLYGINNPIVIGFSTDQHLRDTWPDTYPNILPNLKSMRDLTKEFPFNVCVLGGDSTSTTTDIQTLQSDVMAVTNCLNGAECPVFHLIGNHDGRGNIPSIVPSAVYGSHRTKPIKDNVAVTMGENTTCYYDDKSAKVRFIFITSIDLVGYSTSQGKAFLLNALSTMPNDYEAIIFSHHPMGTLTDDKSTRFDDWNEPLGWSDDLAPYKNKIIACISGHVHDDRHEIVDGILYLSTTCAGFTELNDGTTRNDKLGTAQCTAYDVFVIDRATYTIHCIRYGIGSNRDIVYRVPDYINQIPISTDKNGDIYNETGYKVGGYLHYDGSESERAGESVTGFIPVQSGDIVRFKNCNLLSNDSTVDRVGFYNVNKNSIQCAYVRTNSDGSNYTKEGNSWYLNIITDENGIVQQFTVPSIGDKPTNQPYYMRVSASSIGENSVITVNEPIV